jgi:hypothetical protein
VTDDRIAVWETTNSLALDAEMKNSDAKTKTAACQRGGGVTVLVIAPMARTNAIVHPIKVIYGVKQKRGKSVKTISPVDLVFRRKKKIVR